MLSLKKLVSLHRKIQTLEKRYKTDHRNIQSQTVEFNGEAISMLHYKNREEQHKVLENQP